MTVVWNFRPASSSAEPPRRRPPHEAMRLGGTRALIVTDPGVAAAGIAERVAHRSGARTTSRPTSSISWVTATRPTPTRWPRPRRTKRAARRHRRRRRRRQCARHRQARAAVRDHPGPLADYDDAKGGSTRITAQLPPMIALPTTAGTGSEVGRSGVATMRDTGKKTIFFAPHLIPNVAILDPELTLTHAAARHRGHRLRRAHALRRGVLHRDGSPDGRRDRARRHAARRAHLVRATANGSRRASARPAC